MLLLISGLGDENTKLEFGQIYEKNYRTMYYVALKILKNKEEAEDAVHGAFVKLAEKYDTYRHLTSQEMTSLCVIIVKNKMSGYAACIQKRSPVRFGESGLCTP